MTLRHLLASGAAVLALAGCGGAAAGSSTITTVTVTATSPPTATPVASSDCYRIVSSLSSAGGLGTVEIAASNPLVCVAVSSIDGKTEGGSLFTVTTADHLSPGFNLDCIATFGGEPARVYDDGLALDHLAARALCH